MNKLFSKVATLSVGLAMAIGVGVAVGSKETRVAKADTTVTFTVGTDSGDTSLSKNGVSVITTSGVFNRTDNYRIYANNSMTVSCSSGNITAMSFTISQNTFTADVGTWSNGSWSGSATSVKLSASGGQVRFTTFSVTYSGDAPSPSGHAGTEADPFTVAEALVQCGQTSTNQWYVKGIISRYEKFDSKYSSAYYYISDDGTASNELYVYSGKDIGGAAFTADTAARLTQGKIVVVKGVLKTYNSTKEFDKNNVLISIEEPEGTKYAVVDRVDDGILDKSEILEGSTLSAKIIPDTGYWYPETVTVLMAGSPVAYTYENGVVTVENVTGNVSIEGACVACNQIKSLYTKSNGASTGDFYGYYVGYLTHTNKDGSVTYYDYIVQDGEFGIMIYGASTSEPSHVVNETVLHVSGTISIFNGLYEVNATTVESATSVPEGKVPSAPVVYAAAGGETAIYANRLTTVTGVPTLSNGNLDTAGGADVTMDFTVGSNTVQVFYKKAAQTADAETFAAVKSAVSGSSEITVKGFTGWHNGFQVQMNGYIPPAEDYTAEQFAQDLLDQTDNACSEYPGSDNDPSYSYSAYKTALEAIWSDLASDDKYPSLPKDQKDILADASREGTSTISRAMKRYDFLTGKYSLSNFINGRTPIVPAGMINYGELDSANNSTIVVVVSIATVSALAFTMLLVFKKKKQK